MNSYRIHSIAISPSQPLDGLDASGFAQALTTQIARMTQATLQRAQQRGLLPATMTTITSPAVIAHYLCSSSLDTVCSSGFLNSAALCRDLHAATGVTASFSNAMQCASWGFLLRQHLQLKPQVNHVVLTIMDANPLQIRFWQDNADWGKTSQRITQIHLEILGHATVQIGRCNPSVMLYDYATEIQKAVANFPQHVMALCFFEPRMRKGLRRALQGALQLPDNYDQFGHVCGSDPWIAVALDAGRSVASNEPPHTHYQLSSIASAGYFCFAQAELAADAFISKDADFL